MSAHRRDRSPSRSQNGAHLRDETTSSTGSFFRRSLHVVTDLFAPFSPSALATLPTQKNMDRDRSTRTDLIPDTQEEDGVVHRDYHAINPVRIPKKIKTPIRVEGKVWFANERTWLSYLNISVLIGTLALALYNAADDQIARYFAYAYALISIGVLVYGWAIYQKRITMIRKRDPGHFDQLVGPVLICALLFVAILSNFIIRARELRRKEIPIPGQGFFGQISLHT